MCGIFAYTGKKGKDASGVLLKGLLSLEYRGYDSAGIYMPESGSGKTPGGGAGLRKKIPKDFKGKSGIAHLRWATHGEPSERNAHPHADCEGEIWVVHNGIIENFKELKEKLTTAGHTFKSHSDTEVLAHLVEEHLKRERQGRVGLDAVRGAGKATKKTYAAGTSTEAQGSRNDEMRRNDVSLFEKAALAALNEVRGTYCIALQYKKEPDRIIAARMGSPRSEERRVGKECRSR